MAARSPTLTSTTLLVLAGSAPFAAASARCGLIADGDFVNEQEAIDAAIVARLVEVGRVVDV